MPFFPSQVPSQVPSPLAFPSNMKPRPKGRRIRFAAFLPSLSFKSLFYLLVALGGLSFWLSHGFSVKVDPVHLTADRITNRLQVYSALRGARFIPAHDPGFEYIGRWTWTADKQRADCDFPGSNLEFVVRNCTSVYLSLSNADTPFQTKKPKVKEAVLGGSGHLDIRPLSSNSQSNPPTSLLTQVDHSEIRMFSENAKGLLALTPHGMNASVDQRVRVTLIADREVFGVGVQFQGIWIDEGAVLMPRSPIQNSVTTKIASMSSNVTRTDKGPASSRTPTLALEPLDVLPRTPKFFEVITDIGAGFQDYGNSSHRDTVAPSWEELVGEALQARAVRFSMEGVCLTKICRHGSREGRGIRESYFRSGPPGSLLFNRPWNFDDHTPDIMVMLLGHSDALSPIYRDGNLEEQRRFLAEFEHEYMHLVQDIRKAAYPIHPADLNDYQTDGDGFVYNSAPAMIPILIVAPFNGQMHQSTQRVAQKLQEKGDRSVFWIDSSGWFSSSDFSPAGTKQRRILGHDGVHKAAMYMHAHLCRYLHPDQSQCHFFKHDIYSGQVYIPQAAELEKLMEELKVEKLKALFSLGQS